MRNSLASLLLGKNPRPDSRHTSCDWLNGISICKYNLFKWKLRSVISIFLEYLQTQFLICSIQCTVIYYSLQDSE